MPIHTLLLLSLVFSIGMGNNHAHAQSVDMPSSPNPVGSGARALGMGGAFIAVADDATAASWNPGGLIQLEKPEISVVADGFSRSEENTFGDHPEAEGTQGVDKTDLNYFSMAYPFNLSGYNMVVSLNYQKLYNFSREWGLNLNLEFTDYSTEERLDYKQSGDLSALGLAYSVQIRPGLSLGMTINIWNDSLFENGWSTKAYQSGSGIYQGIYKVFDLRLDDRYRFNGINAHVGAMWQATGKLTVGAVLKTPFQADIDHTSSEYYSFYDPDTEIDQPTTTVSNETMTLTMPMSYGVGAAYRFSDAVSLSMDLYRTLWGDFKLEDASGDAISPVTGQPYSESRVKHTVQARLGAEYLFILPKCLVPVRGGLFYDPSPSDGSPDNYYGLTIGSGLSFNRFSWDISGQYRFGHNVSQAILPGFDFAQDIEEYTVYTSLILYL